MRPFLHTFHTPSAVANIRGLKSIAVVFCIGACSLTHAAIIEFSGQLDLVLEDVGGAVYSGGINEVWLCDLFFASPTTGYYSQATTLIHELSHEAVDTDDIAYGVSTCKDLATNDPGQAINNADNYAFFQDDFRAANPVIINGGTPKVIYLLLLLSLVLVLAGSRRYWAARRLRSTIN